MDPSLSAQEIERLTVEYLATLTAKEMKAYHIAKSHLGMSFTLEKSNGFLQWKRDRDRDRERGEPT